ncbi:uncharacterized protein LOC132695425 [Panthera onca]
MTEQVAPESLWRNRLARSAVNRKVGGSSPPRDGSVFCGLVAGTFAQFSEFRPTDDSEVDIRGLREKKPPSSLRRPPCVRLFSFRERWRPLPQPCPAGDGQVGSSCPSPGSAGGSSALKPAPTFTCDLPVPKLRPLGAQRSPRPPRSFLKLRPHKSLPCLARLPRAPSGPAGSGGERRERAEPGRAPQPRARGRARGSNPPPQLRAAPEAPAAGARPELLSFCFRTPEMSEVACMCTC